MTSISDDIKFIDANFKTITRIARETFDELIAILIATLAGVLREYDISGAKLILPESEWCIQPENIIPEILAAPGIAAVPAGIRPRPPPPAAGIPAGAPPVLPAGPLNAADINNANVQLNFYNAAKLAEKEANSICIKYATTMAYIRTAILNTAYEIDSTAYSILIRNRITNLPDRQGIPVTQIFENIWEYYGTPDEIAKSAWETVFDNPRDIEEPFMTFLSKWTISQTRLNQANRLCTDRFLLQKFKLATAHDPRVCIFMMELRRLYPGDQTWNQLLHLAAEQEANLDGEVRAAAQAFTATTGSTIVPICATATAGGAANTAAGAAANPAAGGAAATGTTMKYCFIHGKRSHHPSSQCKMINLNDRAYPYSTTNLAIFTTAEQVRKAKLVNSANTEVKGIGKGK